MFNTHYCVVIRNNIYFFLNKKSRSCLMHSFLNDRLSEFKIDVLIKTNKYEAFFLRCIFIRNTIFDIL